MAWRLAPCRKRLAEAGASIAASGRAALQVPVGQIRGGLDIDNIDAETITFTMWTRITFLAPTEPDTGVEHSVDLGPVDLAFRTE